MAVTNRALWWKGACAVLALLATPAAFPNTQPDSLKAVRLSEAGFTLQVAAASSVPFKGMLNPDQLGGSSGSILYPGFGLAGFLAAVVTHGAIMDATRNAERTRAQDSANRVLEPYRDRMASFSNQELLQRSMIALTPFGARQRVEATATSGDEWILEAEPGFTMTTDGRALVLDNAVSVYRARGGDTPRSKTVVRVVWNFQSTAVQAPPDESADFERLKTESVSLFVHSLRILIDDLALEKQDEPPLHKTFRYKEGTTEKMERAQLVREGCQRAIVRNLRGWLVSIPQDEARTASDPAGCGSLAIGTAPG
jgi:hypothetical protein